MRFLQTLLIAGLTAVAATGGKADTWDLQVPTVPFDDDSPTMAVAYQPLDHAAKPWRLCVIYPHLKDAYWLSVNYGMVEEAKRLGVSFDLYEAGGYPNLSRQIEQVEACGKRDMDALILGAVSYEGLTESVLAISQQMPVIADQPSTRLIKMRDRLLVPGAHLGTELGDTTQVNLIDRKLYFRKAQPH